MPTITVNRKNCEHGHWSIPGVDGKLIGVDAASMVSFYVSVQERRAIPADQFRKHAWNFQPRNPTDQGKHGVMGQVTIDYELKR